MTLYHFSELDSTNAECRRRLNAEDRFFVVADVQTAGRGRHGKSFYSPLGGLYMSYAFHPSEGAVSAVGITTYAAVAVTDAIEEITEIRCGVKWINDLFLEGKKVCGILAEAVDEGVILGIGINLVPAAVPDELHSVVGWLGRPDIRDPLAEAIARRLLDYRPGDISHMNAYRSRSIVLGKRVRYPWAGGEREGLAVEIDDSGALHVEGACGRDVLRAGEISLSGIS